MELWIRSQDKSNLKIVKDIYVEHIEKNFDSWVGNIYSQPYVITSDNGNLGFYATEERALEVLDEIQKLLTPKMIIKNEGRDCVALDGIIYRTHIVSNINSDIQQLSTYVYEMPEE